MAKRETMKIGALTLLGALVGIAIVLALTFLPAPQADFPPCFELGAPFHHRFRPNCVGEMFTPRGPVELRINEDGLRDLPRAAILKAPHRVLVMGDSYAEGWWATREQALPALLSEKIPGTYFINGAIRSTGPTLQAKRLRELIPIYRPEAILWIINDTDGLDERLACAVASNPSAPIAERKYATPEVELRGWERWAGAVMGRRGHILLYKRKWEQLVSGQESTRCEPCEGFKDLAFIAQKERIPLIAQYISSALPILQHYQGSELTRASSLRCLSAIPLLAWNKVTLEGLPPKELEKLHWENDYHPNPEGMARIAEQMTPSLEKFLKTTSSSGSL